MTRVRDNIEEAKRRLALPQLMAKLGDGDHAKRSARCPFHADKKASFSVFQNDHGSWFWKCHSSDCGSGDEIGYLEKKHGLVNGAAIREFLQLAGVAEPQRPRRTEAAFNWQKCVAAFTPADARKLAEWRGLSAEFAGWLHSRGFVGTHAGNVAFPNHGDAGQVVSAHSRLPNGKWKFEPRGQRAAPLIFGDAAQAGFVLAFESQWDAFAVMDRLAWHERDGLPDTAIVCTRGASNGKLMSGRLKAAAVCYAFAQNDAAAQAWLADVASHAGCRVLNVATPTPHKDTNDWIRAGATKADIETATRAAKPVQPHAAQSCDASAAVTDDAAGVRGSIIRIVTMPLESERNKRRFVADAVLCALRTRGKLYFHAERRDFDSAMFFDSERARLVRVRSDEFKAFLSEWTSLNRSDRYFDAAFAGIETAALCDSTSTAVSPAAYWAARRGAIYLSNGDGQLVRVTAANVELLPNGADEVLFAVGQTLAPWKLIDPRDPFETCALFRNMQTSAPHGRDLFRLWMFSLPTAPRSKPPIVKVGDVGAGKTRGLQGTTELYGLPFVAAAVEDRTEENFWPALDAGGIYTLDNADSRTRWLADAVAAAATGGCVVRRRLYTDAERVTLRANAWLALTTANPTFANDPGLADRLLVVRMNRREGTTSDAELSDEIAANRDGGLSFIVNTLHAALADTAPTPSGLNARHPDWAQFAVRIGRAIGRESEAVIALSSAESDKHRFCLENDNIGSALLAFMQEAKTFNGTAAELLQRMAESDPDLREHVTPKKLGKRLASLWAHVAAELTATKKKDRNGVTTFVLTLPECGVCGVSDGYFPKVPYENEYRDFSDSTPSNPANPATDPEHAGRLV